jgi:IclR family KDG regulon transcriptional repressor
MKEKASKSGSVEKALQIIECFDIKNPSLTLDELSKRSGFPKATTFRMICSLEKYGYIKRTHSEGQVQFQLGMTFLEKTQIVQSSFDIRDIAKSDMLKLRNETGLSVQLAVRDGSEAVYIQQFESLYGIRIFPQVGRRAPLYVAACPRVILAFLPEQESDSILDSYTFTAYTPNTKINVSLIKEELTQIRKKGYAVSKGELHEGTLAVAVPIYDVNQTVIASLSIIGMENELDENKISLYVTQLKKHAQSIEHHSI